MQYVFVAPINHQLVQCSVDIFLCNQTCFVLFLFSTTSILTNRAKKKTIYLLYQNSVNVSVNSRSIHLTFINLLAIGVWKITGSHKYPWKIPNPLNYISDSFWILQFRDLKNFHSYFFQTIWQFFTSMLLSKLRANHCWISKKWPKKMTCSWFIRKNLLFWQVSDSSTWKLCQKCHKLF